MTVEIWSDIMCPWCYIGKRRLERALDQFEHKGDVEITWKSFQLNPQMKTEPGKSINEYLAENKGWTLDHAKSMNDHVTQLAWEVGLAYDFDKAVVANSFDAHRLIQMAKSQGLGGNAEERLFKAYFTEGKNIADHAILVQLGIETGLEKNKVLEMLEGGAFAGEVRNDIYEAQTLGVRGVPFFVIDRKYGISGAQSVEVFLDTLQKAYQEG